MPRLEVKVGPDRFHMEPARLNDYLHPNEINTPHFCGRVLVRILDAPGAREGEPGREYFTDRTRKFCIQIEGRFRQEWSGDDILFGTDFDKYVPFPRTPFNAGMHVARLIDPCTFYEEHPPSGRPYIMSPYLACMNVFCAWPTSEQMEDAVIVYHDTQHDTNEYTTDPSTRAHKTEGDMVPVERLEHHVESPNAEKKHGWFSSLRKQSHDERVVDSYWRFVGFRTDPRVIALLDSLPASEKRSLTPVQKRTPPLRTTTPVSNVTPLPSMSPITSTSEFASSPIVPKPSAQIPVAPKPVAAAPLAPTPITPTSPSSALAPSMMAPKPIVPQKQATPPVRTGTPSVGTRIASKTHRLWHGIDKNMLVSLGSSNKQAGSVGRQHVDRPDTPQLPEFTQSTLQHEADWSDPSKVTQPVIRPVVQPLAQPVAHSAASPLVQPVAQPAVAAPAPVPVPAPAPTTVAGAPDMDQVLAQSMDRVRLLDQNRSVEEQLGPWRFSDPGADMVEDNAFVFLNESVSVPRRRKHFADLKNRTDFKYSPNVVYGASFFSNLMDFNTFDLAIGPVRINVSPYFREMPIRYSLRAKGDEELTFCSISFQLVDD